MSIHAPSGNQLLSRLPPAERQRLVDRMQPVTLNVKRVLYRTAAPIESVYFLNRGSVSTMTILPDGSAVEVATVGKEGLVGLGALRADKTSANRVTVQIAGDALRMDLDVLEQEIAMDSPLRRVLRLYQTAFRTQMTYSVVCNMVHPVQQRCCRWLLITGDRVEADELSLTHEFLGIVLGVRRTTVSEVLRPLNRMGLVRNNRRSITILDRGGLEKLACQCYRRVKNEFERLLPMTGAQDPFTAATI
ncbi:MAG TPA: Crp/Fnr family transcriptional regulator [Pirellulales bacterium]|jgi:CRP-like cAMP-binding protein|nr:Crp/Fnr family transcriptional regulator [Pirellulales bacterium]